MSSDLEVEIAQIRRVADQIDDASGHVSELQRNHQAAIQPYLDEQVWGRDSYGEKIAGGAGGLLDQLQAFHDALSGTAESLSGDQGFAAGLRYATRQLEVQDEVSRLRADLQENGW